MSHCNLEEVLEILEKEFEEVDESVFLKMRKVKKLELQLSFRIANFFC